MRLSCPSCGAEYELPETLFLTGPRKVRCVKCAHSWMAGEREPEPPAAPAENADAAASPAGADAAIEPGPRRPLPLRRRAAAEAPPPSPDLALLPPEPPAASRALLAAWVASFAVLIGGGWAGWTWREAVMHAWPASTHLFTALGG